MKLISLTTAAFCLASILVISSTASAGTKPIHVLKIDGAITPAVYDYLHESIERAEQSNAQLVIVEINTPGGLLKSTRSIVTDFLTSPIPICVYVSPQGAQSASAGVFITLAANIAVMSPGTNIGAAHPVSTQGQMDSVMSGKVTNDAAAFIRTISEKRKRNVQWAEDAVRKSVSITETEALKNHIIDFIAINRSALLDSLEGRRVETDAGVSTLATKGAAVEEHEMGWAFQILNMLSDPNVSYILFLIGIYGLFFELYNPGAVFPGVAGVIAIILALYAFHTMPVNYAGLALIIVGIILFVLEIKVTSYGVLTVGGILAFFFGSIMLFQTASPFDVVKVSLEVVIPAVLCTAAFFIFALGAGIRAQQRKPATGLQTIVGEAGIAVTDLAPSGQVKVQGEFWNAAADEGSIPKETPIIVRSVDGLTLKVAKK
jgi:membrane-bound serine protease (ClpP class)